MSLELITILLFGIMILLMLTGLPLAFALGSVGITFSLLLVGPASLNLVLFTTMFFMSSFVFIAIPLFLLMGNMLERSGIADDLYEFFYHAVGFIPGGLAIGTVFICSIFAAMSGVSSAATVSMGLIALPSMLKRGYSKTLAVGVIMAGGALGFLIPPSVLMIVYGLLTRVSIGQLYAGGILPGVILATIYIIYIIVRCRLQPELAPAVPRERRLLRSEKLKLGRALILPVSLVLAVLGTMFAGVCSPTEASAIGAGGSILCAFIKKTLKWSNLFEALSRTARITGMLLWLSISASAFSTVYNYLGAPQLIGKIFLSITSEPFGVLMMIQLTFIVLGCFIDDFSILFICMPIFVPLIKTLGFNEVWFGVLYIVNMQMAFITPPFGLNLFYMKSVVPKEISMKDIYISAYPFVGLQFLGLLIFMIFPDLVLWLPNQIYK